MKLRAKSLSILFAATQFFCFNGYSSSSDGLNAHTIYGEDSRKEVGQLPVPFFQDWIRRTVALIEPQHLFRNGDMFRGVAPRVGKEYDLCSDEPFYHQPSLSFCTAFFINQHWLVTAKHCVENLQCTDFRLLSSYRYEKLPQLQFSAEEVFTCGEMVISEKEDLAFLKIAVENKAIKDRSTKSKTLPQSKRAQDLDFIKGAPLEILGFPLGLPMKWANGQVLQKKNGKLYAAIDAFEGNSGSPILDHNHELVGILLGGDEDFVPSKGRSCQRSFQCQDADDCEGEEILGVKVISSEFDRLISR